MTGNRRPVCRLLCAWIVAGAGTVSGLAEQSGAGPTDATALSHEGQALYHRDCASCHGADGQGDGAGPALAGNLALANKDHVIRRILFGAPDKGMDPFGASLTDREVAALATFVRVSWDNPHGLVAEADVAPIRASGPTKK